jgi:hypothetical protein
LALVPHRAIANQVSGGKHVIRQRGLRTLAVVLASGMIALLAAACGTSTNWSAMFST